MSITFDQAAALTQHQTRVLSCDHTPLGVLAQVYVDDANQPSWAAVVFDPPSAVETVVPVHDADLVRDDGVVAYSQDTVENGPQITAGDELPWVEERRLREHYGLSSAAGDVAVVKPITDVEDATS